MLRVKNLSKSFGSHQVLHQLNFTIKKGSITGFLGPNGAGKTTTMRIITGFLSPTKGEVFLGSDQIKQNPKKFKKRLGYLPENNPLYRFLTPWEYLKFISQVRGVSPNKRKREIERVVELCSLTEVASSKIETLSRGYQQRVGLAAALVGDPDLLILDEPTTGLDPNQREEIKKLITRLGKTIIFSSHILSDVKEVCDEIIIIHQGKIVAQGSVAQLTKKGKVKLEILFRKLTQK